MWFPFEEMPRMGKLIGKEGRVVVARGWEGQGNEEWLLNGYGVSSWKDGDVLKLDCDDWLHNPVNIPEKVELCILNGWSVWYVNISI